MSTALIERVSKPVNKKIWSDYILSYIKYETLDSVNKENLQAVIALPEEKYIWAQSILEKSEYTGEHFDQYYVVLCLIMKAFLLRIESKQASEKMEELVNYALNELNVYTEFELYILGKYLLKHEDVKRTFEKIETFSKNTVDRLKNTAWDIFHIRMVERIMLEDLKKDKIVFQYIGTKDVGLQNIININPIKILGFLDNQEIIIRKSNLISLFNNKDTFDKILQDYKARPTATAVTIDYKEKMNALINEIVEKQDQIIK